MSKDFDIRPRDICGSFADEDLAHINSRDFVSGHFLICKEESSFSGHSSLWKCCEEFRRFAETAIFPQNIYIYIYIYNV